MLLGEFSKSITSKNVYCIFSLEKSSLPIKSHFKKNYSKDDASGKGLIGWNK